MTSVLGRLFKSSQENYGYLNASLRARSSSFLVMEGYVSIAKGTLNSFEQFLLESRYGEYYREQLAVSRQTLLGRIENAIANGACGELLHTKGLAIGEPAALLEILFARADMLNARLILRALSTGTVFGPPPRWHSYGALKRTFYDDLWRKAVSSVEIREMCYSNGHPFAVILADAVLDLDKGFHLQLAERTLLLGMLDELFSHLDVLASKNADRVKEFLGLTIDTWNMGIWLRKRTGYNIPGQAGGSLYLERGAWLTPERLSASKAMADLVQGTPWRNVVRGIDEDSPRDFQRALSMYMWKWQMKLYRVDPLGIEVPMGYVARQLVEWENLNLLCVGMAMNMSADQLMERIIPV